MSIGDRIRYLIELRQYKQVELAAKTGVTQAAISNLVTDSTRKPSAPTLLRLALALDASPQWIITGEGDPFETIAPKDRDEGRLVDNYRHMSQQHKTALLSMSETLRKG
jgi:transcriptional regulator with XRE-family HTH domain